MTAMQARVAALHRSVDETADGIGEDGPGYRSLMGPIVENIEEMIDVNVYQENIFHTKMLLKDFDLDNYVFGMGADDLEEDEQAEISRKLRREMLEIFYGRNMSS